MIKMRAMGAKQEDKPVNSLYVKGELNGVQADFLVDSGASVSLMHPRVFNGIPVESRPRLEKVQCEITAANGSQITSAGKATFRLCFGSIQVEHPMWVAEVQDDVIMGLDFLEKYCQVDYVTGTVTCCQQEISGVKTKSKGMCRRVVLQHKVVIEPRCEQTVMGQISGRGKCSQVGLVSPAATLTGKTGLLVAKGVVDMSCRAAPVRLLNLDDTPVTLEKNTTVAFLEPVYEVSEVGATEGAEKERGLQEVPGNKASVVANGTKVPDHLTDLYQRSSKGLNDDQKSVLTDLLVEFSDVFAKSSDDFGRTQVVKHSIDTGDAKPIRQPPRRIPFGQREEVDKQLNQMLEKGLIEPSSSPWSSSLVLVKKKDGSTRICVDYRKVNDVTKKDAYPVPRVDDALEALSGSSWFSTLDLKSGYHQAELASDEDKEKTAFTVPGTGLFHFNVLPFGLANAPATFTRLMEEVLRGLPCAVF